MRWKVGAGGEIGRVTNEDCVTPGANELGGRERVKDGCAVMARKKKSNDSEDYKNVNCSDSEGVKERRR